ncbi:MAG: M42 family metallopeptidase [Candidatus Cloacimonetes bacterium]|nr:M42 family metallopeptidase [Candidatus Cloacimonadota bacterium]
MNTNEPTLRQLFQGMDTLPEAANLRFFRDLVQAPGPSGFEVAAQRVFRDFVTRYADEVHTDVHGNVIAVKRGAGRLKVMVVGHADEIGLMVRHIDDDGFLFVAAIGGVDPVVLPGLRVEIHHEGDVVLGVIGRKAIHILESSERDKAPKLTDLWVDIGVANREEAAKMVSVGDVITFPRGLELLGEEYLLSKATDDKCGVYLAGALLKELHGQSIAASVYAVSSTMEEVGQRGARTSAYGIEPDVALAVDVGNTSDVPGCDKKKQGDVALGKGPSVAVGATMNPVVVRRLQEAAAELDIPVQIETEPGLSRTDADMIQITRSGIPCGLISIPNRYMHTPSEVICWRDLQQAVQLTVAFIKALDDTADFRPLP